MAIDLSKLTPQQLDKFLHIQGLLGRQKEAQDRIKALRDYYDGEHPVLLTDRQQEYVGALISEGQFHFAHNTIKSVVDTLRERLSVSGFEVNPGVGEQDENTPDAQLAAQLWQWWQESRYDAQQIRLHRRALRDGKSYVMVSYDDTHNRPRLTLHEADDGRTGVTYHRDPENPEVVMFANKYWYTYNPLEADKTGIQRKTTYLPGEIRKYILGKGGLWEQYSDPGDSGWPLPWVDSRGEPLGIPIIEFENPGGSEVAQIIGLQDALNKSWLDLMAAADAAGFPIVAIEYAESTGGDFGAADDDEDIEGDDEFVVAPGRALIVDGGRVHRIESGDMSQLINVIHTIIETIAGISRTPQYYLRPVGGDVPSGEALKQLESGLVKRAVERQLIFGQSWADVMTLAYRVQQTFGGGNLPDVPDLRVVTLWADPETRQEKSDAEMGEIYKRLNIPDETVWARLGFSPQEIARFKAMQRSDQAALVANVAATVRAQQSTPQAALPTNGVQQP